MKTIENYHVIPACDEVITSEEFHSTVRELLSRLDSKGKTENEHLCINAINEILNNIEKIEFINKRAVMAYLREITKLSPKQLSVVLSSLKKYYKDIRKVGDLEL
jgi:pimeloyl-CoA synthetase